MLIGLHGLMQSGKDTVYERAVVLAERMGLPSPERIAFADPLKKSAANLLGISVDALNEYKNAQDGGHLTILGRPMSIRTFLQLYGTEAHRDVFGRDFWVDASLPKDFDHSGRIVFVTDVRFNNEAIRVSTLRGSMIVVDAGISSADGHASEAGISEDLVDGKILNQIRDDGYSSLDSQVRSFLSMFEYVTDLSEVGDPKHVSVT